MLGLAKTAAEQSRKKEIAEDVMLGGLGLKAGAGIGGLAGLAKGKQQPLANPVGIDEVKTREARKLVNGALHNHQAKWSGIKGGAVGAGIGLGLAGAGIAMNHIHNQKKTASYEVDELHPKHHPWQIELEKVMPGNTTETLKFAERTANPATRHETISELFSNNQLHRYENITPRPLLFGKKKWEEDILQPKKSIILDVADKGGNYHPLMQGAAKHWAETGKGFHAKKS